MKLGEKIKLLRTEKSLTQPELADKAGIEQSYLSKLENDKAVPSFDIINRISMALETSGMDLIDSLSQSYIEDHLSHIPEVAAEYALIKQKRETTMKKRFIAAAMAVVVGIGVFLVGYEDLLFPEIGYQYSSYGIVKKGEPITQFSPTLVQGIESREKHHQRIKDNEGRNDLSYTIRFDKVRTFEENVEGGKRQYHLKMGFGKPIKFEFCNIENDFIAIFGIMLVVSGLFAFLFNIRFKPQ